jgi:hypothetical protein
VFQRVMRFVRGEDRGNGSDPERREVISIALLYCPACFSVEHVRLGHGDLTCHCGAERCIRRIVQEPAQSQPAPK